MIIVFSNYVIQGAINWTPFFPFCFSGGIFLVKFIYFHNCTGIYKMLSSIYPSFLKWWKKLFSCFYFSPFPFPYFDKQKIKWKNNVVVFFFFFCNYQLETYELKIKTNQTLSLCSVVFVERSMLVAHGGIVS